MKLLTELLRALNYGMDYVRANAWHIFLLLVALYILKDQGAHETTWDETHCLDFLKMRASVKVDVAHNSLFLLVAQNRAAVKLRRSASGKSLSSSSKNNRDEEIRRVREQQQELLNERAKIAAEERKKKEAEEKERKNKGRKINPLPSPTETPRRAGAFNPMQPWTSSGGGGGGGYK